MKKRKIWIILIVPILILVYLLTCVGFYFFEPISYHAPDLYNDEKYALDLYRNYTYEKNNSLYIRTLSADDVMVAPDDIRLKYVDNTILAIADQAASYSQIASLASDSGATITGYIETADFYQLTFSSLSYSDILEKCSVLQKSELIDAALPDYFEETPASETLSDVIVDSPYYYYEMIHLEEAWQYAENTEPVAVGMIDSLVDSSNPYLTVANQDDYSVSWLYDDHYDIVSHGTHVAGIIGASRQSEYPGVFPGAPIYSYNGGNVSLSHFLAVFAEMITQQGVRAINISMGYNDYIPIGATLGCESTKSFIQTENAFMEAFFSRLIENGYDFLICIAAGNDSGSSLYKVNSPVFGYGEKNTLRQLDMLKIFSKEVTYCDAEYAFFMTGIQNEDVRDHIIVVGSCGVNNVFTQFSDAGKAVDIVAPGESIYSTVIGNKYEAYSGTSMATPFVTGTAALLYSIAPSLTAKEVKEILKKTSTETVFGYGFTYPLLDAGAAAKYVTENNK